jgi:hypothetical protein
MKNILYIGPYKENSGLGRSSRRYINALGSSLDNNLSIRPVYFSTNIDITNDNNVDFTEYEDNSSSNYDAIIQHGYPDMFVYNKAFGKNIGIVDIETMRLEHTGWIERINLLDEAIVSSNFSKDALLGSGVKIPIKVVPEPFDIDKYHKDLHTPFFEELQKSSNPFIFYFIGNHTEKNNIKGIITAFFMEFNKNDNVRLIIKTNINTTNYADAEQIVAYDIDIIEKSLRIRKEEVVPPQVLIGNMSDADILRFHASCDCYVNAVRAESLSSSCIESALFGNLNIVTSGTGSNTYINRKNGLVVESVMSHVWSPTYYVDNTFTIYEKWYEPYVDSIREQMRRAYELTSEEKEAKRNNFDKNIFSYDNFNRHIL